MQSTFIVILPSCTTIIQTYENKSSARAASASFLVSSARNLWGSVFYESYWCSMSGSSIKQLANATSYFCEKLIFFLSRARRADDAGYVLQRMVWRWGRNMVSFGRGFDKTCNNPSSHLHRLSIRHTRVALRAEAAVIGMSKRDWRNLPLRLWRVALRGSKVCIEVSTKFSAACTSDLDMSATRNELSFSASNFATTSMVLIMDKMLPAFWTALNIAHSY